MKIIKWIGLIGAIFLTGCAQPNFDPKDKYVLYAKGKAYAIPFGVNYNAHVPKQSYAIMRESGIPCSDNGITWHEKGFTDEMRRRSTNVRDVVYYMKQGYDKHLVGCAEPLTNKEYQYLLKQQERTVTHHCPMCKNK